MNAVSLAQKIRNLFFGMEVEGKPDEIGLLIQADALYCEFHRQEAIPQQG